MPSFICVDPRDPDRDRCLNVDSYVTFGGEAPSHDDPGSPPEIEITAAQVVKGVNVLPDLSPAQSASLEEQILAGFDFSEHQRSEQEAYAEWSKEP
jgi:hypothetical protein